MGEDNLMKAVVLVGLLASTVTGFLLSVDRQCTAHCDCTRKKISCDNKTLTDVPVFDVSSYKDIATGAFEITLQRNNIVSIPGNAFENISYINAASISIYLSSNEINRIDPLAFSGIENRTIVLDLNNNNLNVLPLAIARLYQLQELYILGNPLSSLDPIVVSHIGRSLYDIEFEMGHFKSWPIALSMFQQLGELQIDSVPSINLPQNAFKGIEFSLIDLKSSNFNQTRIPTSICNLHNINTIILENAHFQGNSVFMPCSHTLPATELTLRNLSIQEFPGVLQTFQSLTKLDLSNNEIAYIPSDVIPMSSSIVYLKLSFNQLTRVPFALKRLTNLVSLEISNNHIVTIEDHDLVGLSNLAYLSLNSNPIQYIAQHAFDNNTGLFLVNSDNTKLRLIPEVVKLQHIEFTFSNTTVECSCRMSYLKGWDPGHTTGLDDNCANRQNETVTHYILNELRQCP